ncbi:UPF0058 family protein [Methanosarcina barkeri]|uniref:UPF0058 family protein n=1 Tax=Methanosarcina barkeri TaxID=2208 RepID=UPI0009BA5988
MHKEELIQLHTYMAQMKRYFERHGVTHEFDDYKALSISPVHIHRSKADHKRAIFITMGAQRVTNTLTFRSGMK